MSVIAIQGGKLEWSGEDGSGLQLDGVATLRAVQRRLEILVGVHSDDRAGSGGVRHRAGYSHERQLRGAVEAYCLLASAVPVFGPRRSDRDRGYEDDDLKK